jgi:hypothetical protein
VKFKEMKVSFSFDFQEKVYQKVLEIFKEREVKFQESENKVYPNLFFP